MNLFYGSITTNQNKTVEQIAQELQVAKQIQQLINDDDSFVISPQDYDAILQKAQELANDVTYYDLGCGVMEVIYPLSGLTGLISNISGSTDPFYVGNQVNASIAQSTKNTPDTSVANKQTIKSNFFQFSLMNISTLRASRQAFNYFIFEYLSNSGINFSVAK